MTGFNVLDLSDGRMVDLDTHLAGRWGPTQILELPAGTSQAFGDGVTETCLFLIDGNAELELGGSARTVPPGTGVTLVRGTRATLTATDQVRLFVATLNA